MIEYIRDQLPDEVLLIQLAEECDELAHAALKLHRILDGRNPTPVKLSEAWANLQEEIVDVLVCLTTLGIDLNEPQYDQMAERKLDRWVGRLMEGGADAE